jgi:hypothetical protein
MIDMTKHDRCDRALQQINTEILHQISNKPLLVTTTTGARTHTTQTTTSNGNDSNSEQKQLQHPTTTHYERHQ